MVFVESETSVTFTTKIKLRYGSILMVSECFTEMSYARRHSDGLLIEFDDDGFFKSASLNGEEKTMEWLDEHNERSFWDIGCYWDVRLRGVEQ